MAGAAGRRFAQGSDGRRGSRSAPSRAAGGWIPGRPCRVHLEQRDFLLPVPHIGRDRPGHDLQPMTQRLGEQFAASHAFHLFGDILPVDQIINALAGGKPARSCCWRHRLLQGAPQFAAECIRDCGDATDDPVRDRVRFRSIRVHLRTFAFIRVKSSFPPPRDCNGASQERCNANERKYPRMNAKVRGAKISWQMRIPASMPAGLDPLPLGRVRLNPRAYWPLDSSGNQYSVCAPEQQRQGYRKYRYSFATRTNIPRWWISRSPSWLSALLVNLSIAKAQDVSRGRA